VFGWLLPGRVRRRRFSRDAVRHRGRDIPEHRAWVVALGADAMMFCTARGIVGDAPPLCSAGGVMPGNAFSRRGDGRSRSPLPWPGLQETHL